MAPEHHIRIDGTLKPRSKFLGNSVGSFMEGIAVMRLLNRNERYFITQPNMYARGILFGKMKYELGDHAYVRCPELGLEAEIDFKVKGWMTGTYNAIGGHIKDTKSGKSLFELSGYWDKEMYIKNLTVRLDGLAAIRQPLTYTRPARRSSFSTHRTQNLHTPKPALSTNRATANRKSCGTRSPRPSRLPTRRPPQMRNPSSKTASAQKQQSVVSTANGHPSSSVEREQAPATAQETWMEKRTSTGLLMPPCLSSPTYLLL